jgi:hypothetical protein
MKNLLVICFSLLAINLSAQETSRKFDVKGFDKLEIGSAFVITVVQGNTFKVEAKGREKDIDDIEARVKDGKLIFGYPNSWINNMNRKTVYVSIIMPALNSASFSGATTSKVNGFKSENMKVSISGASNANFDIDAKNLTVDCSGASQLKLIGKGNSVNIDVSGASTFNGYDFTTSTADIDASGASQVKAYVSGKVIADASGASGIYCKGGGSMKANTSGASSAKMLN